MMRILLGFILIFGLIGCNSGGSGSGKSAQSPSNLLVSQTSVETAQDILSRYGYSVEEYWKIVDSVRFEESLDSEMRILMQNCKPVYTENENLERIVLVDVAEGLKFPDYCKIEFLYEKVISGSGDQKTITSKMVMKFKDPYFHDFFAFQSLDCVGSGSGTESPNYVDVTFSSQCAVVDSHYGKFDASHSTRVAGLGENMKVGVTALITTPGRPEISMLGGAAQVRFDYAAGSGGAVSLNFNGQPTTTIASPGWQIGLRMN